MMSTRRIRTKQQPKWTSTTRPKSSHSSSSPSSSRKRPVDEDIVPTSSSTNKKTRISIPAVKIVHREKPTEVPYEDLDEWAQFFEHDYLLDPIPVPLMRFGKRKTTPDISEVKTFVASSSKKVKRQNVPTMTKKKGKSVWRGRPVKQSRKILMVKPRRDRVASPDVFDNSDDADVFEFTDDDALDTFDAFEGADISEEEVETPEATKVAETIESPTPIITPEPQATKEAKATTTSTATTSTSTSTSTTSTMSTMSTTATTATASEVTTPPISSMPSFSMSVESLRQQIESQNREIAVLREHLAYVEKDHTLTKRAMEVDRSEIELVRKRVDDIETERKKYTRPIDGV